MFDISVQFISSRLSYCQIALHETICFLYHHNGYWTSRCGNEDKFLASSSTNGNSDVVDVHQRRQETDLSLELRIYKRHIRVNLDAPRINTRITSKQEIIFLSFFLSFFLSCYYNPIDVRFSYLFILFIYLFLQTIVQLKSDIGQNIKVRL